MRMDREWDFTLIEFCRFSFAEIFGCIFKALHLSLLLLRGILWKTPKLLNKNLLKKFSRQMLLLEVITDLLQRVTYLYFIG